MKGAKLIKQNEIDSWVFQIIFFRTFYHFYQKVLFYSIGPVTQNLIINLFELGALFGRNSYGNIRLLNIIKELLSVSNSSEFSI